ncbi:MAG TPA: hypothetical protein VE907_15725 [Gammaproteobacteria bacterium]|nr:hypothetical protein [Gammaproteobacteria bacterium]
MQTRVRRIASRLVTVLGHMAVNAVALSMIAALVAMAARAADDPPNLEGVWGMVQHDRLGAPFFIPIEPTRTAEGKKITDEFVAKYNVKGDVTGDMEANAHCVEPGMPTVMWGIGGAAMEIVQQEKRVTLLSELAKQTRRIYMDGRDFPSDFPDQRVGFSLGHWEGDTLVIETRKISEWHAPRWPHSDQMRIVERWYLTDASKVKITGLRPANPPKVTGKLLINEMTINDPGMYADKDYKVTTVYRKLEDNVILEDNCSEGIWMEQLDKIAAGRAQPAK